MRPSMRKRGGPFWGSHMQRPPSPPTTTTQHNYQTYQQKSVQNSTYGTDLGHGIAGLVVLGNGFGASTSKDDKVQQRVGSKSVGSVYRHTGGLASVVQTFHYFILAIHVLDHLRRKRSHFTTSHSLCLPCHHCAQFRLARA